MNEGNSSSEPLNTCTSTSTTIVLSLEKEGRPRNVRFPFIDWDEETQRTARGFAQRKERRRRGKKMTPEDRTQLMTRSFQWLTLKNNHHTILELYSSQWPFRDTLDLLWAGEQKNWFLYSVIDLMEDKFIGACGGHPRILRKLDAFGKKQEGELNDSEKNTLLRVASLLRLYGVILDGPTDSSASQTSTSSQPSNDEYADGDVQSKFGRVAESTWNH
jgi:hypothetical protein